MASITVPAGLSRSAEGQQQRFVRFAWAVLAYNILVVLWGALVRATGSGAGCGDHWPLCNGEVLPSVQQAHTAIEFTHRAMSGICLLAVAALPWWARKLWPKGHAVRRAAFWSLIFVITEALIGAGLVLFRLVAHDASLTRAVSLSLHLINTYILLGTLALTAWFAAGKPVPRLGAFPGRQRVLLFGLFLIVVVSMFGAVTSLGDTLYPAKSLAEGIAQDLNPVAPLIIRTRVFHPLLAIAAAIYWIGVVLMLSEGEKDQRLRKLAMSTTALFTLQLVLGGLNIYLLAPVWMQLVHLFLADAVWLHLVLFTALALAQRPETVAGGSSAARA